jgi:hypothetical protein
MQHRADEFRSDAAGSGRALGARFLLFRCSDNLCFRGMAGVILATVFLGFARTYYLAGVFKAEPLPPLLHVHGAVFTIWMILLVAQTSLVAGGRVDLHRRLGLLGFCLACLLVAVGMLVGTNTLVRYSAYADFQTQLKAGYIGTSDVLIFAVLIYFAFRYRSKPATHKRLVLIATIALLDAAFSRWPIPVVSQHAKFGCYALLLLLVAFDLWNTRKVHRATLWASVLVLVAYEARGLLSQTASWQAFAAWVQNLAVSSHLFDSRLFH